MPKTAVLQTSFIAGELAPELTMRQEADQYQNGAKSMRNYRCLIGGGAKRRPGSRWLANLNGRSKLEDWIVSAEKQYIVAFSPGLFRAYLPDGTAAGSVIVPWDDPAYREIQVAQSGNVMFVTHQRFPPQIIQRTGDASWTCTAFTWATGVADRIEQPYLKVVDRTVTLQPSALTGTITLTASEPVFDPLHAGAYIRYIGRQAIITTDFSPTVVQAVVIEKFPPTQNLTVTSSVNFSAGEVVQGGTSGAKGQITSIPDGTHINAVIIQRLQGFANGETLIGPNQSVAISTVAAAAPAAVTDWDEQLFSEIRGYPACVELHRNRLLFAGAPAALDYLISSINGNLYNFDVGTGADTDAIIEPVGDSGASRIVQLHSAEQLLVLTDQGPYYVPEGPSNPFRPSSIAFFPFGSPWPITPIVSAEKFDNGVLFCSGSLIIKARPTGSQNSLWDADEVSILSPHLVRGPLDMAVVSNFAGGAERYAAIVNSDGTMAVAQLLEAQKIRNFTPWDCSGSFFSVAALGGSLYVATQRNLINGGYSLEVFDDSLTLDCASTYNVLSDSVSLYGMGHHVIGSGFYLGTYPLNLESVPAGPYTVGFDYTTRLEPLPPVIQGPQGTVAGEMMRIMEADIFVQSTARFATNGTELLAYQSSDDFSAPPPLKDGAQRFQFFGWRRDPTIAITQIDPLGILVKAVKTKVAY